MKYFDAEKRRKEYIDNKNTKELKININSKKYLDTPIENRLDEFISFMDLNRPEEAAAVDVEVTIEDTDDDFLDDTAVFDIMSNIAVAYARTFPKQEEKVLSPKRSLMDGLPISPMSVVALTMLHIVDIPLQITAHRHHRESDSYEKVRMI